MRRVTDREENFLFLFFSLCISLLSLSLCGELELTVFAVEK